MSNQSRGTLPTPLSPEVADRLLGRLATDDQFRSLFVRDPAAALVQAGYDASATNDLDLLRSRLKVTGLASKEAIAAAHSEIRSSLTSGLNMQPIQLNTGGSGRTQKPE
ncbi:MAG TPA: NHLP-related RiPP peptide [Pseudoxanthomonas sp.]|nr:NHLP-related RiPP peptide [Pseudoxanthomonas sp.]